MRAKTVHCTVVEVDRDAHLVSGDTQEPPRDLLPWADPYIARLLTEYRLQAALDDSLRFVSDEAARALGGRASDSPVAYRDSRGGRMPSDQRARFTTSQLRGSVPPAAWPPTSLPPAGEDRPLE